MTHNGGYYGVASADGRWLYYSVTSNGVWKVPAEGGEATQVLPATAVMATVATSNHATSSRLLTRTTGAAADATVSPELVKSEK